MKTGSIIFGLPFWIPDKESPSDYLWIFGFYRESNWFLSIIGYYSWFHNRLWNTNQLETMSVWLFMFWVHSIIDYDSILIVFTSSDTNRSKDGLVLLNIVHQ